MERQECSDQTSLAEHLRELRSCLLISLAAVLVGFVLSSTVIQPLVDWFLQPLVSALPKGQSLIFTSYQEGFFFT